MPRITQYTEANSTNLQDSDVFITDGPSGVSKISAESLAQATYDKFPTYAGVEPVAKRGLYRGASLGSGDTFAEASTAAQRAAIVDGSFEGLFIGDYWIIGGRIYRIADFNYWLGIGDEGKEFNTNHIVLLPDATFGNDKMNDGNVTTGGYVGSKMYSNEESVLNVARATISDQFGNYLATHREYLCNAVTSGAESAGAWFDSTAELMNEVMVYGTHIRTAKHNGTYLEESSNKQLALFMLNPFFINPARYYTWLRNVASATLFAYVGRNGSAGNTSASDSYGVRPAFAVKGTA